MYQSNGATSFTGGVALFGLSEYQLEPISRDVVVPQCHVQQKPRIRPRCMIVGKRRAIFSSLNPFFGPANHFSVPERCFLAYDGHRTGEFLILRDDERVK